MKFEGIITPVITPVHDDHSIDRDGFATMIDYLVDQGVHGIIVGGSTGEYYAQSHEERLSLIQFAAECVKGRLPLIIGTGSIRTEESIMFAEAGKAAKADAVLIGTPPYAVPTERENALHALAIDRAVDMPIMLYNYPGRMGVCMGEEYLNRIGRSKNVKAIKESSGDINRLHLLARDYPHISLSCGMDDQALEFFAWGAASWTCAGSNFLPKEHIALYEACVLEGDFVKGRKIMSAMLPLMRILEQGGKFIQCVKHGVTLNGLPAGDALKPLRNLNKDEKRSLEQVVRTVKVTIQKILDESKDKA